MSGLTYANEMNKHANGTSQPAGNDAMASTTETESLRSHGNAMFDLGYGMVEVALAITVGLFLAALVVYPLGKRRSGLFSF
jgi:hypothetical protein